MAKILKKILILGILTACASKGHWKQSYINTGTEYSSSKLVYAFPDPNNSLKLEIFRTSSYCKGYISVQSHPFIPWQNDPKKVLVSCKTQEGSFLYLADLHEGGQRALLPFDALEKIISSLLEKSNVLLEVSGYTTKISWEGFDSKYKNFQSPSKIPKIIQLPL